MAPSFLIAGLGNPGKQYAKTRHNIGFRVVDLLAKQLGCSLERAGVFSGLGKSWVGTCSDGEKTLILLQPGTFMNLSGNAVIWVMNKHKVPLSHLLVVVDDIAIPFGEIRLRSQGSSGGHNGLKNIEATLQTNQYARLRIGVGDCYTGDLSDYVLSSFSMEEEQQIPNILEQAVVITRNWIREK